MKISTLEELRNLYALPRERAVKKQLPRLDAHCRRFIALSPFVVMATGGATGTMDASPRGGAPGFVKVTVEGDLLIPDAPGNNRLDSLDNVLATGRVGLLFLIPGVDETLRVNGAAVLSRAAEDIAQCADERRAPKLVIRVTVDETFLHCAKALLRSRLWDESAKIDRAVLPTMGRMLNEQTGIETPPETQEEMIKRYAPDL
ncbi:MAG: pyridoxamine 5'-phosphate oxidase family protein [Burkholderiales bacterium]|nr:pyridoxamine 5'-phosphate oxidase family protein [Burkholderiales bacterium]